jgi:hypothetical protein
MRRFGTHRADRCRHNRALLAEATFCIAARSRTTGDVRTIRRWTTDGNRLSGRMKRPRQGFASASSKDFSQAVSGPTLLRPARGTVERDPWDKGSPFHELLFVGSGIASLAGAAILLRDV